MQNCSDVKTNNAKMKKDRDQIKIVAHRGASGYAPENTLSSMTKAIEMKSYMSELDVQETADGEIILLEVNPRPSGSTISYLPFGINLYYILAKSYLSGQHINIDQSFYGKSSFMHYRMVKGE